MWVHYLVHVLWSERLPNAPPCDYTCKVRNVWPTLQSWQNTQRNIYAAPNAKHAKSGRVLSLTLRVVLCAWLFVPSLRVLVTLRVSPDCAVGGLLKMRIREGLEVFETTHKQNRTPNHLHLTRAGRSHQILRRRMPMEEHPSAAGAASCYPVWEWLVGNF